MFIVHGTKKFLDRVGPPNADPEDRSTTALGNWYATPLFWKPQVALFTRRGKQLGLSRRGSLEPIVDMRVL